MEQKPKIAYLLTRAADIDFHVSFPEGNLSCIHTVKRTRDIPQGGAYRKGFNYRTSSECLFLIGNAHAAHNFLPVHLSNYPYPRIYLPIYLSISQSKCLSNQFTSQLPSNSSTFLAVDLSVCLPMRLVSYLSSLMSLYNLFIQQSVRFSLHLCIYAEKPSICRSTDLSLCLSACVLAQRKLASGPVDR